MLNVIRFLTTHPLNRSNRSGALMRFVRWQIGTRLLPIPHVVPFVDDTILIMEPGMTGATGNWYCGLHEHADMAFVLHFLRPDDLFVDVGANVGSYTILAAGCAGARTVSIEPIPSTFEKLQRNVTANNLSNSVICHNIGAGSEETNLSFISSNDTTNRVATKEDVGFDTIDVPVHRLDDMLSGSSPHLMKIDVEGWEAEVLKGLPEIIKKSALAAVIMETNSSADRYESKGDKEVMTIMAAAGFKPCSYDPFGRKLVEGGSDTNTIFVRDFELVRERTKSASQFQLVNGVI